jgi:hypothetical protein
MERRVANLFFSRGGLVLAISRHVLTSPHTDSMRSANLRIRREKGTNLDFTTDGARVAPISLPAAESGTFLAG